MSRVGGVDHNLTCSPQGPAEHKMLSPFALRLQVEELKSRLMEADKQSSVGPVGSLSLKRNGALHGSVKRTPPPPLPLKPLQHSNVLKDVSMTGTQVRKTEDICTWVWVSGRGTPRVFEPAIRRGISHPMRLKNCNVTMIVCRIFREI